MSLEILGLLFFVFCFAGVPIAFSIGAVSVLYFLISGIPLVVAGQRLMAGVDSFPLLAAPLFVLAGVIMSEGGIMRRLIDLSDAAVGHMRGGLAQVNVFSSMLMSSMSGTATSLAATGTIIIPAMTRSGYPAAMSAAITASSSVIGPIIPPSVPLVIYGAMAQVSIGQLFIGAVLPGLLMTGLLMLTVYVSCRKAGYRTREKFEFSELRRTIKAGAFDLALPTVLIGGLLLGWFTAVEAAAVAVVYALVIEVIIFRDVPLKRLPSIFISAARLTGLIMFVIAVSNIFGWILVREGAAQLLADSLLAITDNPYLLRIMLVIFLLILGLFVESIVLIVMIVPVLATVAPHLDMDPVHLGVTVVLTIMIGLITPPVGLCMFIVNAIAKISVAQYTKAVMPSFIALLICVFCVALIPALTTWLPAMMME